MFCVIGNPIEHSLSPQMHNAAFGVLGLPYSYGRLCCHDAEDFKKTLDRLKHEGYLGANITIPFKKFAFEYADNHDEFSEICGASNVIAWKNGESFAYNTDGDGFLKAVHILLERDSMSGKRVAVLGACGGAGVAISHKCAEDGATLTLINREKTELYALGEKLGADVGCFSGEYGSYDLVINATPLGLKNELPLNVESLSAGVQIFDCVPKKTRLIEEAERRGIRCMDGREMLLWQGVLSFKKWFPEVSVPVDAMRAALFS